MSVSNTHPSIHVHTFPLGKHACRLVRNQRSIRAEDRAYSRLARICQADAGSTESVTKADSESLYGELEFVCEEYRRAPLSVKQEASSDIFKAFDDLNGAGILEKWGKEVESLGRRNIFMGDLKLMGIKDPEKIAQPTIRNDLAFIVTIVGTTSVLAVAAGQLPGDWGFFVPYFTGRS